MSISDLLASPFHPLSLWRTATLANSPDLEVVLEKFGAWEMNDLGERGLGDLAALEAFLLLHFVIQGVP